MKTKILYKWFFLITLILSMGLNLYGQNPSPEQINQAQEILKNNPDLKKKLIGEGASAKKPDTPKQSLDTTQTRKALTTFSTDTIDYLEDEMSHKEQDTAVKTKKADAMPDKTKTPPKARYGMKLFTGEHEVASVSDVPEDYVIVPGDQILLRLWGRYNLEKIYTLGDDGYVFIDPLNKQTYMKGMTHKRVKQMIRTIVKDMAGVEGEAKVISSHPIKINISGEAKIPGTILVPPYFTFWQAVKTSKGPSQYGSLRDIRLVRSGKVVYKLDVYDYLKTGKIPSLALKENDLIFYGPIEHSVTAKGGVKRPGLYEIKKSENFGDLVAHAGGLSNQEISSTLQIERTIPIEKRKPNEKLKKVIDVDITAKGWQKVELEESDIITSLTQETEFDNNVYVMGDGVKVPGRYSISEGGSNLADVVKKAGGLKEGFVKSFEIIRIIPTGKKSLFLDIQEETELAGFQVLSGDSVLTYHQTEFVDSTFIKLTGFVRDSVEILYTENLSLEKVIQRAGGLKDGALPYVYIKHSDEFHNIRYEKVNLSEAKNTLLQRRDEVLAFGYYDFNKTFPVIALMEGKEPFYMDYSDNLTLEVIIHNLGGLLPHIDSNHVEINTPEFSSNETYVKQKTLELNPGNLDNSSLIVAGAMIIFRKDSKKLAPGFVHLLGEFKNPGRYALRHTKESLTSILEKSGGLTNRANPYSISIHRQDVDKPLPVRTQSIKPLEISGEWLLTNGDSVFVRRNDFMVEIEGAVLNPSVIQWSEDFDWEDYVNSGGGGPLDTADIKRTFVIYPNGVTVKAKKGWFSSSEILPGSKIIVPFKPYKPPPPPPKPFNYNALLATVSASLGIILVAITISEKVGN